MICLLNHNYQFFEILFFLLKKLIFQKFVLYFSIFLQMNMGLLATIVQR